MLFDKFENKVIITGVLTAVDPIHIGSSNTEALDPTQIDSTVMKDADGRPIIPGSSLKGVIRSNFESVMNGIGKKICDIFSDTDENCLTKNRLNEINKDKSMSHKEKAEAAYRESCEVCRLFGGRGIASKLQFKDCAFIGDKCIYERRDGVRINRETGAAADGGKFDYEIVPKGTKFTFYMSAENLDEGQEKYLDYILNTLQSGELSIGGKTTRGLGRIILEDMKKEVKTADELKKLLGLEG